MNQKVCKQFHPFASSEMTFQSAQRERFVLLCFITCLFHKKTDCYIFYFALVFLFASSTGITAQHGLLCCLVLVMQEERFLKKTLKNKVKLHL